MNSNSCQICDISDSNSDKIVELQCGHTFCQCCLNYFFKIDENFTVDSFICPMENCNTKLSQDDLMKFVENYEKVIEKLFDNNICFDLQSNERIITCFNLKCKVKFVIWKDAQYFTCQQCKQKFCLKCKLEYHPTMNCLENMRKQAQSQTIMNFLDLSLENNSQYKACPECLILIQKQNGCNYVTCESSKCRSKTHFCFQCGLQLTKEELKCHYEGNDYFSGKCRVKVNGVWQDKDKVPQNDFACPGCQTTDPFVCKIDENVNKLFVICTSEQCVYKTYCLYCKQQFDDQRFIQHLKFNFQHKDNGKN